MRPTQIKNCAELLPDLPWVHAAAAETGVSPFPPGKNNPRITGYHHATNLQGYDDKVAWCSSFVNWSLAQVGIAGTGSGLARSWLSWGEPLQTPIAGCIVVLSREDPAGWRGHVGFYLRCGLLGGKEHIWLLGGNQLDEVREHSYPLASVLGYRWPPNWPRLSAHAALPFPPPAC